jgi:transcriptional regulator with XRE-family HTH domain
MRLEEVLGQNVRRLRQARELSQEKLAAEVGVDMRYLGDIERGKANPSLKVMAGIAEALGVPVRDLLKERRSKVSAGRSSDQTT